MKNNIIISSIISLVIGFGIGYFTWDRDNDKFGQREMMHQMSNGQMMQNSQMGGSQMTMDSMMDGMMMGLSGKTGDDFDKAFLSGMIVHHQGAVAMAQAVLATSKRPELLKLANDIIAAQTKEIQMMQGWQKSWFTK